MTPTRELGHPKLAGFDVQAYLAAVTRAAAGRPCLLCGNRHTPRIHAWCERLVRCADGRNHELVIVSLICEEAKQRHKQYTKRMLPWFVIPECNIRLDLVLNLLKLEERDLGSGSALAYEQADAVIGSACQRRAATNAPVGAASGNRQRCQIAVQLSQATTASAHVRQHRKRHQLRHQLARFQRALSDQPPCPLQMTRYGVLAGANVTGICRSSSSRSTYLGSSGATVATTV